MACALRFYMNKDCKMLKGVTQTLTEYWNNLFDNYNRNLPWQGLKLGDDGFEVIINNNKINQLI